MKIYALSLLSLFLVSCVAHFPEAPKGSSQVATIRGSEVKKGFFHRTTVFVKEMDGLLVNYAFSSHFSKKIRVPEGVHTANVSVHIVQGLNAPGPFTARGEIKMKFEAGTDYQVKTRMNGTNIEMWIIDTATGARKSAVTSVPRVQFTPEVTLYL